MDCHVKASPFPRNDESGFPFFTTKDLSFTIIGRTIYPIKIAQ